MTIHEDVEAVVATLGLPYAAVKYTTASNEDLPAAFLTYIEVTSWPGQHADNAETERLHRVQINYYNRSGLAGMPGISAAMTAAGFMRGPERDIAYNQVTGHFGRALEFTRGG